MLESATLAAVPRKRHPAAVAGQAKARRTISWDCHCVRCDHEWTITAPQPPEACARCRQLNWWIKRPRGRPPKEAP